MNYSNFLMRIYIQ